MQARDLLRCAIAPCLAVGIAAAASSSAHAADAGGCSDVADLKRFSGSSIVLCAKRDFAEYTLPTGGGASYDFNARKGHFDASLDLEGRLTQNVYAVPPGPSSAEVFRNYQMDMAAKGFRVLFQARQAETGPAMASHFENMGPGTQIWGYSPQEARYAAAVKEDGDAKTYIALYIVEYQDGYEPRFTPAKGQVMVRLDVLQVGALSDRMVVVSAAQIANDLDAAGRISLYGVLFDFNKASIKPESRPALDEIARFLKNSPAKKIYVVGHTDNVGGFDFNMQLSKARAASVVTDLTRTYGIPADRMTANGVGLLSPVASNATEDGRAKNRRVELLPRDN